MAKIIMQKTALASALELASKIAGKNKSIAALSSVLVTPTDGGLEILAFDGETAVRKLVPAENAVGGPFTVECAPLLRYVKLVRSESVGVSVSDATVTLSHANGKVSFSKGSAAAFPTVPSALEGDVVSLTDPRLIAKACSEGALFCSDDQYFPAMRAVRVWAGGGKAGFSATDSMFLIHYQQDAQQDDSFEVLVGRDTLPIVAGLASLSDACEVRTSDNHVSFIFADSSVRIARLLCSYPNVERVLPKNECVSARFDRAAFSDAFRRLSALGDAATIVQLSVSNEQARMEATDLVTQKTMEESVLCGCGGEASVGINPGKALTCLSVLRGESLEVQFRGPMSPVVMKDADEPGKTVLLMPMATRS